MTQPSPLADPATWDLVGDAYDQVFPPFMKSFSRDAIALAAPAPGAHVLDVAAGPGTLALLVAPEVAHAAALDFSPTMIARLRQRAAEVGLTIDARVGDGQELPWPDASFDAAFSMFGLIFFPDRDRGLRELFRVLRPGGRAVVGSWLPFDDTNALTTVFAILRTVMPELPLGQGKPPLGDPDEFTAALRAAGFHDIRIERATHEMAFPDVEAMWTANVRGNAPIALLRQRLSPARWQAFEADVLARLRAAFGAGEVRYGQTALLGLGVR